MDIETYIKANALMVYGACMIAAALLHWGQKVRKGEATADFLTYWFTETPGYSAGTFGALFLAWWTVYTTNGLENMAPHMVVEGGFATGWLINSAISQGSGAAVAGAANKAAGFVRLHMLPVLIALSMVAACASFGLAVPQTTGQRIVQAYGNANAVSAMIPGLVNSNTIDPDTAQGTLDASRAVRESIDLYWDGFGMLVQCRGSVAPPDSTAPPPPIPPECAGPQGLQLLNAINLSLIKVETFLLRHKGGAQ